MGFTATINQRMWCDLITRDFVSEAIITILIRIFIGRCLLSLPVKIHRISPLCLGLTVSFLIKLFPKLC
ncbi:hypothetical protein HanRHA438_Chr09g0385911 [Helianthus annuus]|nr:hypothetical protein HanIR_Chr09g0403381 [Helianthus annuus]KAJ0887011.1 hypothetical protein HanRHA438_Chr09g0385911 [Helianthus annuus]